MKIQGYSDFLYIFNMHNNSNKTKQIKLKLTWLKNTALKGSNNLKEYLLKLA